MGARNLLVQPALWCLRDNHRARRFYEACGFRAIGFTAGADNDEGMPDVRYRWQRQDTG